MLPPRRALVPPLGVAACVFIAAARPLATVSGRLIPSDGRALESGAVVLAHTGDGTIELPPPDATLLPDGAFTFRGVAPGDYELRARAQTRRDGPIMFATFVVRVGDRDVTDIAMTLRPGALLDGEVKWDRRRGAPAPPFASLRVRAPLTDGSSFGDALTGAVRSDGRFEIRGLMTGRHQVLVEGLPPSWTLGTVILHGRDITDDPIDVDGTRPFHGVIVGITDAVSVTSGRVVGDEGRGVADIPVIVFPDAPQFWMRTNRRVRFVHADPDGRFEVRGLPPGRYLALARQGITESDLGRADWLRQMRPRATSFVLAAELPGVTLELRPAGDARSVPIAR